MTQIHKLQLILVSLLSAIASILLYTVPVYYISLIEPKVQSVSFEGVLNIVDSVRACDGSVNVLAENGNFVIFIKTNKIDFGFNCMSQVATMVQEEAVVMGQKAASITVLAPEVVQLKKNNVLRYFLFPAILSVFVWAGNSFRQSTRLS